MNPPGPHATFTHKLAWVISQALKATVPPLAARIKDLEHQVAELHQRITAAEAKPSIQDRGVWTTGIVYEKGDIVSHHGSAWICGAVHLATGADLDHASFRLLVKRGKDAR